MDAVPFRASEGVTLLLYNKIRRLPQKSPPTKTLDFIARLYDIENCMAYVSFISQFSIWKTATICAINHAVIHKHPVNIECLFAYYMHKKA